MWGSILLNILCSVSAAPSSIVFFVLVQGTVHVRVACLSVPTVCGLYSYHMSDVLHSKHNTQEELCRCMLACSKSDVI